MTHKKTKERTILLVEDNPAEARLAIEVIGETIADCRLLHAKDGAEAMEMLRDQQCPRPDLVLLDLNLPRMDGPEVLREIRADPELNTIPVVILSNSALPSDVQRSYQLRANCFVTKPMDYHELVEMMRDLGRFWFSRVALP